MARHGSVSAKCSALSLRISKLPAKRSHLVSLAASALRGSLNRSAQHTNLQARWSVVIGRRRRISYSATQAPIFGSSASRQAKEFDLTAGLSALPRWYFRSSHRSSSANRIEPTGPYGHSHCRLKRDVKLSITGCEPIGPQPVTKLTYLRRLPKVHRSTSDRPHHRLFLR